YLRKWLCRAVSLQACQLLAARELERGDTCAPVECAVGFQVFICVPEGAIVHRIDRHGAVVAPAVQSPGLRPDTSLDDILSLHCAQSIGGKPSSVTDAWVDTSA